MIIKGSPSTGKYSSDSLNAATARAHCSVTDFRNRWDFGGLSKGKGGIHSMQPLLGFSFDVPKVVWADSMLSKVCLSVP